MTLSDVLKAYGKNKAYIRQGHKLGVSGSQPVMTYSGWNDWTTEVPEKLWYREVRTINASPIEMYDRPSAVLEIILEGYEEL